MENAYWSVDDCCWVLPAAPDEKWLPVAVAVPLQRDDEAAQEPVDA